MADKDNPTVPKRSADRTSAESHPNREELDPDEKDLREKMMDKTLADSYPASDPPSSIPDPSAEHGSEPADASEATEDAA